MPLAEGTKTQLRRHGDIFERLPGGYYTAKGRSDDTMNLGGIKVSLANVSFLQDFPRPFRNQEGDQRSAWQASLLASCSYWLAEARQGWLRQGRRSIYSCSSLERLIEMSQPT